MIYIYMTEVVADVLYYENDDIISQWTQCNNGGISVDVVVDYIGDYDIEVVAIAKDGEIIYHEMQINGNGSDNGMEDGHYCIHCQDCDGCPTCEVHGMCGDTSLQYKGNHVINLPLYSNHVYVVDGTFDDIVVVTGNGGITAIVKMTIGK
jgi:hypothetical protein